MSPPIPKLATLFVGILLTLGPHVLRLPVWVSVLVLALIAWRGWAALRNERLPRKWLLMALVAAGVFAVYMHYGTVFGRDAGVAMLVLFLGLKLLETRDERDVVVVTFLSYFLVLANFFYSQTLLTASHMAITVIVLTAAIVGFNAPHRPWRAQFRTAGLLTAQALPLALVLFILFPRFDGPVWALPDLRGGASTGLSDSMAPGSISQLSQSDAIAFRIKFDGAPPARSALYWRGPVFWDFDGRTWQAGHTAEGGGYTFAGIGDRIGYEVTLEPHDRHWLFALELAARITPDAQVTADYQILSRRPVRARQRYRADSYLEYRATSGASPQDQRAALALPEGYNPRAVALGREWRQALRSDRAILERALAEFRARGLIYTVSPPLLGRHSVDEFLFETKQGFCEHFASAFVVLMRAAAVPARVVTGYQGGALNPFDGQVVVRQADAHAWAEIWLEGHGWMRVDPTATIAPARVESGLAAAVPATEPLPFMIRPGLELLATLRHNWEALANYWNQWVLGYNPARQRQLLSYFGMPSPSIEQLVRLMFVAVGISLLIVLLLMLRERKSADPVQRLWNAFCAKLAAAGTTRRPHEGPEDFTARAALAHPEWAARIRRIGQAYVELRYGRLRDYAAVRQLREEVRRMPPRWPRVHQFARGLQRSHGQAPGPHQVRPR